MSDQKSFIAFITKYALSRGIEEARVIQNDHYPSMVCPLGNSFLTLIGEGREWHRTREGAVVRAEQMRVDKIASLQRQVAKLEKLRFTP